MTGGTPSERQNIRRQMVLMFTVCQYPSELANDDQELTDPSELHINVDGGRNCVDQADQHNLEKSLKTAMQKKLI